METHFASPQYYRHIDGGLYRAYTEARHTEDLGAHMVYEHVWPFPVTACVRPAKAFALRFTPISEEEALQLMTGDRKSAQEAVRATQQARRAQEGKSRNHSSLHLRTGQSAEAELYKLVNAVIADGWEEFRIVTFYVSMEDDHDRLIGSARELSVQTPDELNSYELIVLDGTQIGLDKPWQYTYDPANMTGALTYL